MERADLDADVAAKEAVALCLPEFRAREPAQFDGRVAEAASGVDLVRGDDGASGARVEAGRTGPAGPWRRPILGQVHAGEQLGKLQVGPMCRGDDHGALRQEADAGADGQRAFEHRDSVCAAVASAMGHALPLEPLTQGEHAVAQPAVVVPTCGIARNLATTAQLGSRAAVVDPERDGGADSGPPTCRVEDPIAVVREVVHLAVASLVQPVDEVLPVWTWVGGAEADQLEPTIVGQFAHQGGCGGHGTEGVAQVAAPATSMRL